MIAEYGVYTQTAFYAAQLGRSLVKVAAILHLRVEHVARDDDDVRLTGVDLLDHAAHLRAADFAAEVQVGDQRDAHPVVVAVFKRNAVRRAVNRRGIDDAVNRNAHAQRQHGAADSAQRFPAAEGGPSGKRRQTQQQRQQVSRSREQQRVQKQPDGNAAGQRDCTRESRGGQKIPDDKQQRQQHQHGPENIGAPEVEHRPQPAYGAQADVNDCGDKQKNHQ